MVVALKTKEMSANGETAKAETTAKVTGIGSYKNQSDFEKVADQIKAGVPGYANLLWSASVAALIHYDKHGNSLVFKPLWAASKTFSAGEGRKWFDWLATYSKLVYNPLKLRGEKLATADFNTLFKRDKSKVSDIDGAKTNHWRDHKMTRATDISRPIDLRKQIATYVKSLQKLIDSNRLVLMTADGKGIARKAGAADVRSEIRAAIESLTNVKLKAIDGGKAASPAKVTAKKAPAKATAKKATRKAA